MAAILRVRDENGHVVGIPAIVGPRGPAGPGTGDMLESVYDTEGKRRDVFAYANERIGVHNTDGGAHEDIRQAVANAQETAEQGVQDAAAATEKSDNALRNVNVVYSEASIARQKAEAAQETADVAHMLAGEAYASLNDKAPMYAYGTAEPNVSDLQDGQLYFMYE